MTEKNSGPEEGIKGVVEDVKGKAKEAIGTVTGRDELIQEGKAQQDKADAERDVAKKEAEAEAARGGAKAAEKRQEAFQRSAAGARRGAQSDIRLGPSFVAGCDRSAVGKCQTAAVARRHRRGN
jgi:uncharacterized protein YjbJ (UPF0337 family)